MDHAAQPPKPPEPPDGLDAGESRRSLATTYSRGAAVGWPEVVEMAGVWEGPGDGVLD